MFVLHAFQKKSKSGIATPKADIELITRRLKQAIEISKKKESTDGAERLHRRESATSSRTSDTRALQRPSRRPSSRARLPRSSPRAVLTQAAAAELLNIDQPKVSALVRGRLAGFSLDRLVRFLVLLGSDVEIVVKPRRRATARGGTSSFSDRVGTPMNVVTHRVMVCAILAALWPTCAPSALAQDQQSFRVSNVNVRYGWTFQEPGIAEDVPKNIFTFENTAAGRWWSSYLFVDVLRSWSDADANAKEVYGEMVSDAEPPGPQRAGTLEGDPRRRRAAPLD